MKLSLSRGKQRRPLQKKSASCLPLQVDADQQSRTSRRGVDVGLLSSNFPDAMPVLPGEDNLLRIYFADLIADVLKASS